MAAEEIGEVVSPQEYIERERKAEFRSEYAQGRIYAMAGTSREHSLIAGNIYSHIHAHLRDKPCEVHGGEVRVRVSPYRYTYPDLSVACEEIQFEDAELDTLLNPVILIEVLSPSTEAYDRGKKFAEYRRIPSLQEYVMVGQDKPCIEHYLRQDNQWLLTESSEMEDSLRLRAIGCDIPVAVIYEKVRFPVAVQIPGSVSEEQPQQPL